MTAPASPPSPYRLALQPAAVRDLRALSPDVRRRVDARMLGLAADPRPSGVKQLAGPARVYRVRAGDYRILYEIDDAARLVRVSRVRHRSDAYRKR